MSGMLNWDSWDDEDDCFLEPLESLRAASASMDLHESPSCGQLLPCGLLPEELAELEELQCLAAPALQAPPSLKVGAAVTTIATCASADELAPLTPQGPLEPAAALCLLREDSTEDLGEAAANGGLDAAPLALGGATPLKSSHAGKASAALTVS